MALGANPTQRALALDAEILICNTSNIDSMRHGRPETVMIEELNVQPAAQGKLPNGAIVTLGDTKEKSGKELDHVRAVSVVGTGEDAALGFTAGTAAGRFIIVSPEINVEQYRRIDNSIANHMLVLNETYTAYELALRDRIEYSQDYLANPDAFATLKEGDKLDIDVNGKLVANGTALRVVSIREQRVPLMHSLGGTQMFTPINMIKVEVVK